MVVAASMASSTAAALKNGALFIAVCAVLLHSSMSMAQQPSPYSPAPAPSPRLDCSNCGTNCTQRCQAMADAQARYCELSLGPTGVYPYCFQQVANHTCNGNAYAAHEDTCTIGNCTAKSCGCPCVQAACNSCTAAAQQAYSSCMMRQGRIMQFCMPDCTSRCQEFGYCVVSA